MFFKIALLAVFAFLQVAYGQQQGYQGSQGNPGEQSSIQGMTATQMWNPYSWVTPYYEAANNAWGKYFKDSQQASNQLYQQWDKTGAANLFNFGVDMAQQAAQIAAQQAKQAQQVAEQAAQQAQQQAQQAAQMAAQQAQQAQQTAQQAAQQGQEVVQSVVPF